MSQRKLLQDVYTRFACFKLLNNCVVYLYDFCFTKKSFHSRVAVKKPMVNDINRKRRLEFAKKYKDWSVNQWKKVL